MGFLGPSTIPDLTEAQELRFDPTKRSGLHGARLGLVKKRVAVHVAGQDRARATRGWRGRNQTFHELRTNENLRFVFASQTVKTQGIRGTGNNVPGFGHDAVPGGERHPVCVRANKHELPNRKRGLGGR